MSLSETGWWVWHFIVCYLFFFFCPHNDSLKFDFPSIDSRAENINFDCEIPIRIMHKIAKSMSKKKKSPTISRPWFSTIINNDHTSIIRLCHSVLKVCRYFDRRRWCRHYLYALHEHGHSFTFFQVVARKFKNINSIPIFYFCSSVILSTYNVCCVYVRPAKRQLLSRKGDKWPSLSFPKGAHVHELNTRNVVIL